MDKPPPEKKWGKLLQGFINQLYNKHLGFRRFVNPTLSGLFRLVLLFN